MRIRLSGLLLLATTLPLSALAQDLSGMAGALKVNSTNERTFVAAISYTQPVGNYNAMSLSYINEGHPEDHHRDGMAGQFWLRTKKVDQGLMLGAGVGRYFFFDTARTDDGLHNFDNDHGWGSIVSLQARWQFDNRWYAQAQINRIKPDGKDNTTRRLPLWRRAGRQAASAELGPRRHIDAIDGPHHRQQLALGKRAPVHPGIPARGGKIRGLDGHRPR